MILRIKNYLEEIGRTNLITIVLGIIIIISGVVLIFQRNTTEQNSVLKFSSNAFNDGDEISSYYTCDGQNMSPDFSIDAVPIKAKTLSIIIENTNLNQSTNNSNPYAANLIVWNIPATTKKFYEGERPPGTIGKNLKQLYTYESPCPPTGEKHIYKVTLYATKKDSLPIGSDSDITEAKKIIEANALSQESLTFSYTRK